MGGHCAPFLRSPSCPIDEKARPARGEAGLKGCRPRPRVRDYAINPVSVTGCGSTIHNLILSYFHTFLLFEHREVGTICLNHQMSGMVDAAPIRSEPWVGLGAAGRARAAPQALPGYSRVLAIPALTAVTPEFSPFLH
jgi:hypothetical protein